MDFRILGPLEVSDDGRHLELGTPKQRALLAVLLLRGGVWASADALIDALWGERPPETARFALHNYIAGLRRALGPGMIVSHEGGYRLVVASEQVDLNRFERLLEESRGAEGRERLEHLREALALWRGPALADLLYEPFADEEAPRLEELRTSTLEELTDAELTLGEGPELVGPLEALVNEHPYRERLRGQLMLALYRSGRQVEALECYRQTRQTLVEELGIEPGSALRELEQSILRQDPSLQPPRLGHELPPLSQRRKTVTVLFAELRFAESLDPELLRETSMETLARARTVLEAHGATVEQRASDELMAVFGLPRAHEDDPVRAARAALELQGELGEVELRLALESGEVLAGVDEAGHGFVTGAVVPLARHLLDGALPREVLVGEVALGLLGGAARTEPHDDERPARLTSLDEQALVAAHSDAPLAGRRSELEVLHAAFSDAVEERSTRLLLLIGEPGIGKTRLAAELIRELEGRATIARGCCLSYGQALSYWPLVEALRALGSSAEKALEQLTTGAASSPLQLATSVQQALARAAAERPLLLLLEDVHWAEPVLLNLLELVCERRGEAPILILCLARPELLEQRPEWSAREFLRLEPLPRSDAESLLGALVEPPGRRQRKRVLDRAAGNPLFLEELSAFLAGGGDPEELPPRLQVLLQARLDLLPEPQRLLVSCAALEGMVFHRGALEVLLTDSQQLETELSALTRNRLIRHVPADLAGDECFRFRHQLIRDAGYRELPKIERARLHERFADWLAEDVGERTELQDIVAYHLEQAALTRRELESADPVLESRAAGALAAAAVRAQRHVDLHAMAALGRRALALVDESDPRRPELELALGMALTPLGEYREARGVLERAGLRAVDACLAARIRIADLYVRLFHEPEGVSEAIRRECARAIPLLEQRGDHGALALAWFMLAEAEWFDLQVAAASEAFGQAAAHAQAAGDPSLQLYALHLRVFYGGTAVKSYAATLEEAAQLEAKFPDEPTVAASVELGRAFVAYDHGETARARRLVRRATAAFDRWGFPVLAAANKSYFGVFELLNGELAEAEHLTLQAIDELERFEERTFLSRVKAQLASLRVTQGRYYEALDLVDEAERLAGPGHRYGLVQAEAARTGALLALGEIERAKAAAQEAVAAAEATDSLDHRALAQLTLARALAAAGELAAALEAAREAARIWSTLDRKLLGARAAALVVQIERAMSSSGVPTTSR